jgi:FemAB-related protein (PEP-CTERM system-associated)
MSDSSAAIAAPAQAHAPLEISIESGREDWDIYAATHPEASFYHLSAWQSINDRSLRARSYFLCARRAGRPVGILPLTLVASPWFGRILCSMPFVNFAGPCADDSGVVEGLVSRAMALTSELRADCLELRTRRPITLQLPVSLHKVSLTLEMAADPDVLWNGFTSKHRTAIRRALKNDLTVRSGGADLLAIFYALMEQSWHRLGTPLYAKEYFASILAAFPEATRIFVCYCRDEPVAAAFNGYCNGVVEGMWAAGGLRARELQANYVLYWEMMRDACLRGYQEYHLGRSTADSGAEEYKKKWNAQSKQLYWYYHQPNGGALPELNVDNPKYRRAIAIWRRLPLWSTRLIGPVLARSIP